MRIVYHLGAHCTDEDRLVRCLLKNRAVLAEAGIAVPRRIAVCGFDGIEAGQWSNPSLTTIRQDLAAAGRMLVAALLEGGPASQSRVPVHLIPRDSTAAEQERTSEE